METEPAYRQYFDTNERSGLSCMQLSLRDRTLGLLRPGWLNSIPIPDQGTTLRPTKCCYTYGRQNHWLFNSVAAIHSQWRVMHHLPTIHWTGKALRLTPWSSSVE